MSEAIAIQFVEIDRQDRGAIDEIVSQTRVLLNTAGPFALYGDALAEPLLGTRRYANGTRIVDACVRYRTHYVDITGETPWVKEPIDYLRLPSLEVGRRSKRWMQVGFGANCRVIKSIQHRQIAYC